MNDPIQVWEDILNTIRMNNEREIVMAALDKSGNSYVDEDDDCTQKLD